MMKKVTMLVFILMLCITGIASAVEIPACYTMCYPEAGPGGTVLVTAYDESDELIDFSEMTLIEVGFENAYGQPDPDERSTGFALIYRDEEWVFEYEGSEDLTAELVDGSLAFTMIEPFYNHNRWTIGGNIGFEDEEGHARWGAYLVAPQLLVDTCTDCDGAEDPLLTVVWPPEYRQVVAALAAGGICEFSEPGCEIPVTSIVVDPNTVYEEGETTAFLPVSLGYAPAGDVEVTVYSADPNYPGQPNENFKFIGDNRIDDYHGQITLSAGTMSGAFEVQALDDDDIEGDIRTVNNITYELTMISTSTVYEPNFIVGDPNANAFFVPGSVTVIDDDVRAILFDLEVVELSENDPNVWICADVWLSAEPTAVVNVSVEWGPELWAFEAGMVETDADVDDPNYLQFTPESWDPNDAQQVCFAAIDNDWLTEVGVSHIPAELTFIPSSEDPKYNSSDFEEDDPLDPSKALRIEVEDNDCGSYGWNRGDFNEDCYVNLADFAQLARAWLSCTDPGNIDCAEE